MQPSEEMKQLEELADSVSGAGAYLDVVAIVPVVSQEKQRHSWRVFMVQEQNEYVAVCTITTHKGVLDVSQPLRVSMNPEHVRRVGAAFRQSCEILTMELDLSSF
jgi:hypothetical protein